MKIKFERNRTSSFIVLYSLYLYFLGLSLRNTSKALKPFKDRQRSHVSVWNWVQRFGSFNIYNKHRRVSAFIIDETVIQMGWKNTFGYGSVLNLFINLYLEYTFLKREICS